MMILAHPPSCRAALVDDGTTVANTVVITEATGYTLLDLRPTIKGVSPGKRAYDWLIKGRGYSKFTAITTEPIKEACGFTHRQIVKAYAKSCKVRKSTKVKALQGHYDHMEQFTRAARG